MLRSITLRFWSFLLSSLLGIATNTVFTRCGSKFLIIVDRDQIRNAYIVSFRTFNAIHQLHIGSHRWCPWLSLVWLSQSWFTWGLPLNSSNLMILLLFKVFVSIYDFEWSSCLGLSELGEVVRWPLQLINLIYEGFMKAASLVLVDEMLSFG